MKFFRFFRRVLSAFFICIFAVCFLLATVRQEAMAMAMAMERPPLLARFGISTHDDDAMTSFPWLPPEYSHRRRGRRETARGAESEARLYIDDASHA